MVTPATKTARSARETMARQVVALESQCQTLGQAFTDARAECNRMTARAAVDGSKAASDARTAATGAVVRAEAELKASQDALAQIKADLAALDEKRADATRLAKLKAGAAAIRAAVVLAEKADKAAADFAESYQALVAEIGNLYGVVPAHLKEPVFGGGSLLGKRAIDATADFLISRSGLTPRPLYAPTDHRQSLASLVTYFARPLLDEADAAPVPDPEIDWE